MERLAELTKKADEQKKAYEVKTNWQKVDVYV